MYSKARENLIALRERAPLVMDDSPSLYFYRLRMGAHEQTGIAGCFSVDEYQEDVIRKHERTRRDKEDDRTRHIVQLRAQTGVVFLTYPAAQDIDALVTRAKKSEPLYDFKAPDGVHHTVWRAGLDSTRDLVSAFGRIPALYIADGHHRAASAARARTELLGGMGAGDENAGANTFIAVAFPHNQVQILPYNRTVKDLAGRVSSDFLELLRKRFNVKEGPATPRRKGEVSMFLAGKWYTLDLSNAEPEDESRASGLDVALLQKHILERMLDIGDIRTDKRIDFVGGARGTSAAGAGRQFGQGRGGLLDVPGRRGRSDGHLGRWRDHAAKVDVVRTEASRRSADPHDMTGVHTGSDGGSHEVQTRVQHDGSHDGSHVSTCGSDLNARPNLRVNSRVNLVVNPRIEPSC